MTGPVLTPYSTQEDRLEQLEGGLLELACDHCGAAVRVKKLTPQHTSVQWTTRSVRQCAEFAVRAGDGRPTALIPTCGQLRDTVERAAREGRLDPTP